MSSFLFRARVPDRWGRIAREVQLFAGPDRDHRELAGSVVLKNEEWDALRNEFLRLRERLRPGPAEIEVEEQSAEMTVNP